MSPWTKEEKELIFDLWKSNWTINDIAVRLLRSRDSIAGYIARNKRRWPDLEKPSVQNRVRIQPLSSRPEIEDPPREVPLPEGALNIPWIELEINQCQWGTSNDFFEAASNVFLCCGLAVEGGKGIRRRFCKHHVRYGLKNENSSIS